MLKSRLVTRSILNDAYMLLAAEMAGRLSDGHINAIASYTIGLAQDGEIDKVEGLAVLTLLECFTNWRASSFDVERMGFEPELIVNA